MQHEVNKMNGLGFMDLPPCDNTLRHNYTHLDFIIEDLISKNKSVS